ncbi:uncharacterized protein [Solanum tuberosum]|uniref:uncharacterized protein n=1 Tax=Solanum tuberosum TaxID=4113 RepID=UPI00073A1322|nr:PREDICTED: uncharacterized protein LOC107061915 [Solanum tuberosum]
MKSTSTTGSILFVPFEEESTSISDIQMQPPGGQIFYIDGQLTLTNEDQHFCIMACSDCNIPFTRSISSKPFYCIHCDRSTMLIPRVQFDITVTDHTGSATASVSAEKMLHLSIQEIVRPRTTNNFMNNCATT